MENVEIRHLFLLQHEICRVMRLRSGQYSKADLLTGKIVVYWNSQSYNPV